MTAPPKVITIGADLDAAPVSEHDRALIFDANARKLLKL